MGKHRRLRTAARWLGLGLAVGCVALALATIWLVIRVVPARGYGIGITDAAVGFALGVDTRKANSRGISVERRGRDSVGGAPRRMTWWFAVYPSGWGRVVVVPLWVPAALGVAIAAAGPGLERWSRRRVAAGRCPECDYDRSTLPPGSPCPECGAAGTAAGL